MFQFCLRLGDNDLILSQRLGEWCGHGPVLEEDLALANVALDLLGQARLWLSLAAELEGRGRDEDQLAFLRDAGEFRNLLLVEQANGDYAATLARQYYFDAWHALLLERLALSSEARVAAIAAKAVFEVRYHLERSRDWIIRLGDGTEESHARIQAALDRLWPYTGEMFQADGVDAPAGDLAALRTPWLDELN
ncbi:MAG: 1,2-phenylacetyl-CoA epoxidase subunit PaaC, partial [Terriglobales bacterium]